MERTPHWLFLQEDKMLSSWLCKRVGVGLSVWGRAVVVVLALMGPVACEPETRPGLGYDLAALAEKLGTRCWNHGDCGHFLLVCESAPDWGMRCALPECVQDAICTVYGPDHVCRNGYCVEAGNCSKDPRK